MSIVKENLNFERGIAPMKSMGLGSPMFQMIKDLHMEMRATEWELFGRPDDKSAFLIKGTLMKIFYDKKDPNEAFTETCNSLESTEESKDLVQKVIKDYFNLSVKYLENGKNL